MTKPILLVLMLMLGACARTPPAQYYLLSAPVMATAGKADGPRLGLGPIRLPEYLDRPQIVSWASATRLSLSNSHRWAEPLQQSFARALLAQLAQALPEVQIAPWPWRGTQAPARQIALDVQRFERGADGVLHLDVRWTVQTTDGAHAPLAFDSAIALPVAGAADDYDAIVAAASAAVGALASDIAARLPAPPAD